MKDKITFFIVGLLLGAIISTSSIYIYTLANNSDNDSNQSEMRMRGGNPPSMENGQMNENGQTPELPSDSNFQR